MHGTGRATIDAGAPSEGAIDMSARRNTERRDLKWIERKISFPVPPKYVGLFTMPVSIPPNEDQVKEVLGAIYEAAAGRRTLGGLRNQLGVEGLGHAIGACDRPRIKANSPILPTARTAGRRTLRRGCRETGY